MNKQVKYLNHIKYEKEKYMLNDLDFPRMKSLIR